MPDATPRIALFGGTFDPPHKAHLAIARAAADHLALDAIYFAPAGRQPLKPHAQVTPFADRLAMVAAACASVPHRAPDARFHPSDLDAPLPNNAPNYTLDTLTRFAEQHPASRRFNLVGADSFRSLGHWREPHQLLALAEWIVVSRPGHLLADPEDLILTPEERTRIHLLDAVHLDLAATALRARLAHGDPCADLLPPAVAAYIQSRHLYR